MINVYAWPPVGVVGTEWTEEAPVQTSRSMLTGKDYVSAYSRKRKLVTLNVSALSLNRSGAGYSEVLKRLLDGGVNAVRLNSYPVNWWLDAQTLDPERQSQLLEWTSSSQPLDWESSDLPLSWYSGKVIFGTITSSGGYQTIAVTDLPPNTIVARPAEYVTVYENGGDLTGATAQVLREARSDANGNATIFLLDNLPAWGTVRVNVGASATGAFRPIEMPRAIQPLSGNWNYTWKFREVFADEVGGFTEVDPWN